MDFLVCSELNPQSQWQLELMIESFRSLSIQDRLVVCFTTNDGNNIMPEMTKNLSSHSNTMLMPDFGTIKGYHGFNKLFGIITAMREKRVGKKFVLLDPDMVICKVPKVPDNNRFCAYQTDSSFTIDMVDNESGLLEIVNSDLDSFQKKNWPMASTPMIFTNFPVEFFEELVSLMEAYVYKQYLKNDKVWDGTTNAIFNLGLHRHIGEYNPYPIYDLSCSMQANKLGCFINYRDGFMPMFHKSMFPYTPPNFFSLGNPFKILSQYAPTQAFQYMSALAQLYLQA